MVDRKNPGQFGNRPDTSAQASKGGKASSAKSAAGKSLMAKHATMNGGVDMKRSAR